MYLSREMPPKTRRQPSKAWKDPWRLAWTRNTKITVAFQDSVPALRASVRCGGRHLEKSRDVYHTGFRENPEAPVMKEQPVLVLKTIPEVSSTANEHLQNQLDRWCFFDPQGRAMIPSGRTRLGGQLRVPSRQREHRSERATRANAAMTLNKQHPHDTWQFNFDSQWMEGPKVLQGQPLSQTGWCTAPRGLQRGFPAKSCAPEQGHDRAQHACKPLITLTTSRLRRTIRGQSRFKGPANCHEKLAAARLQLAKWASMT